MDQSFDGIAKKFDRNIYGTLKGKLRHSILSELLKQQLGEQQGLRILDLGGGTGVMAEQCLKWGHSVDVVDISQDVLQRAKMTLQNEPKVRFYCSSLQAFESEHSYDVVLCHAVLEWLANPLDHISALMSFLKPDGLLSLSVFNRDAAVFGNMTYGNFDYVQKGLKVKKQVRLNPKNPISPQHLLNKLAELDLKVLQETGVRCFSDYVKRTIQDDEFDQLLQLEKQYNQTAPYKWLGKYFHVFVTR